MSFFKKILIIMLLFVAMSKAWAQSGSSAWFVEPGVGINFSERKNAFGFNFKLGITIPGSSIFLGVDGGIHNLESREPDGTNISGGNDLGGVFAGYNSGQWRFSAGYYPYDVLTWDKPDGQYEYTGDCIVIGMGIFLTPSLSFNLDYRSHYFNKLKYDGETTNPKYYYSNAYLSFSYLF